MKHTIHNITYGIIIISLLTAFVPPAKEDPCMQELKNIYEKYSTVQPEADKVFYIDYTVRSVTSDGLAESGTNETSVKMCMLNKLMYIKSNEMEVYRDEKDAFTVLPQKKMILRADADLSDAAVKRNRLQLIQDTLLSRSKIISCKNGQDGVKHVELELTPEAKKSFNISKAVFRIRPLEKELLSIRIYRGNNNTAVWMQDLAYVEYTFRQLSADYKLEKPEKNIEKKFIVSGSRLKPAYKDYTLIDNRNK